MYLLKKEHSKLLRLQGILILIKDEFLWYDDQFIIRARYDLGVLVYGKNYQRKKY
jgi:hypothetical protein